MVFRSLTDFLACENLGALDVFDFPKKGVSHFAPLGVSAQAVWAGKKFLKESKPILIIAKEQKNVDLWLENLSELVGEENLLSLPVGKANAILEEQLRFIQNANRVKIAVATPNALLNKLPSARDLAKRTLRLKTGNAINSAEIFSHKNENEYSESGAIRDVFTSLGFTENSIVEQIGDFSIRGCIIDINPLLCEHPIRIELWGDSIESIRTFDIFSQRSIETIDEIEIFPMDFSTAEQNGADTKTAAENFAPAIEFLSNYLIITDDYYNLPLELSNELSKHAIVDFSQLNASKSANAESQMGSAVSCNVEITPQARSNNGFAGMEKEISAFKENGGEVYLLAPTQGQALRLYHLSQGSAVKEVLVGHISEGFWISVNVPELGIENFALLSDHQIFNRFGNFSRSSSAIRRKQKSSGLHSAVLAESLIAGDFVVHEEYGVGKYLGLTRIAANNAQVDCVMIEYADKARLTFPVGDLYKLEKLVRSEDDSPPTLNKLGTQTWEKAKEKAKKKIAQIARALVDLYAKREFVKGFAFPPDTNLQEEFENDFPFSPTPDQIKSVKEIKTDMEKSKPMDRLLCGDVGFGKTEVAMRAIFKCINSKKQAAVLVPTTVLAAQHYQSFTERFSDWNLNIALVNRYKTNAEKKEIYKELAEGKIDLVVGTHSILSDSVKFKDLGILVIDEEQKFGVKQKEKLREMRLSLDTLAMSATPIPRTLQLSMTGVRDISFINTPPLNRLPVETKIMERNDPVLAAAVRDEIERGGQVFVVNDRVQNIEKLAEDVESWMPNLRVAVAHAQMPDNDLEKTMSAFINKEFDVLVCTVLIESGLDVPNANTIIIMNANHFGVGQLYQLRGRVGRSATQAKAFLVTPQGGAGVTKQAKHRLTAMEKFTDLGAGYQVAMRDLEIRGAGNLLGMEQHGFIEEIGFETYTRMVKEAVDELRGTKGDEQIQPRLDLRVDAYLPENWIADGLARISIYQRIAKIENSDELRSLSDELRDRFGPMPKPAKMLILSAEIGLQARAQSITGIARKQGVAVLTFSERTKVNSPTLADFYAKCKFPLRFLATAPMQAVIEIGNLGAEKEIENLLSVFE